MNLFGKDLLDGSVVIHFSEEEKSAHAEWWDYSLEDVLKFFTSCFPRSEFFYKTTIFADCKNCVTRYIIYYRGRKFYTDFYYHKGLVSDIDNYEQCKICQEHHE